MPVIFDRLIFFIPTMIKLRRHNEVFTHGVVIISLEALLWSLIVFALYTVMYIFRPHLFELITFSVPALVAWVVFIANSTYRYAHFGRIVKRDFYYVAYMRYIQPDALENYRKFLQEIDEMRPDELNGLLSQDIPYMHRQAVIRKIKFK